MPFSVLTSDIKADLSKFTALFAEAEDAIKYAQCAVEPTKIEDIAGGVIIPAINQLRYAGKHLANAMLSETSENAIKEIKEAQTHCERAMYDAYDATVQYYFASCHIFKDDYKNFPITQVLPQYVEDCKKLNDIVDIVSRERRQLNERNLFAHRKKEQTGILCEISQRWESAREELNKQKEISRQRSIAKMKRERESSIREKLCLLAAIASLVILIYTSFIQ